MPFTHEGYNLSYNVHFFSAIPHLQLTNEGILPLSNTTFDYGRLAYVNSLLVTFTIPILLLLLLFAIYILYILIIRYLAEEGGATSGGMTAVPMTKSSKYQSNNNNNNNNNRYLHKAHLHKVHNRSSPVSSNDSSLSTSSNTRSSSIAAQYKCHILYLAFGVCALVAAIYGTVLLFQGLYRSDQILTHFIQASSESKIAVNNFTLRYLPAPQALVTGSSGGGGGGGENVGHENYGDDGSVGGGGGGANDTSVSSDIDGFNDTDTSYLTASFNRLMDNALQTIQHYTGDYRQAAAAAAAGSNASTENVLHFQTRFRYTNYLYTSLSVLTCLLLFTFWLLFVALTFGPSSSSSNVDHSRSHRSSRRRRRRSWIEIRHFVLYNILILVLVTLAFNGTLTTNIAMSDFCLTAKPVITDITVYKIPSNNFTTKFVHYYLYCDLNRWNLDRHKATVIGYLDHLDRLQLFNSSRLAGLVSNVKTGIEAGYDALHCVELNRIINQGLSAFCTEPVDGLTILTVSYLFSCILLIIILFMVTFTL